MRRTSSFCIQAVALWGFIFAAASIEPAFAGTFTVTNTNDSGPGSLRQAILDSNDDISPPRLINFAIGTGVQTISPLSQLPFIRASVNIDATTQPGFAGTPIIEINGTNTVGSTGLIIFAGFSTVRGLVINRFDGDGIQLSETNGIVIERNFIGTDVTGSLDLGNSSNGIFFGSMGFGGHVIRENVISGNGGNGISLTIGRPDLPNSVLDNFIGTNASGTLALGNDQNGIRGSLNSMIVKRNVISGNGEDGINSTGRNLFQGNLIGTDVTGTLPIGNAGAGIRADIDQIGGPNPEDGNKIAFNGGDGVVVSRPFPVAIPILSNSIFSNGGLGIDIDDDGVSANDACDADSDSIALQNYPILTSSSSVGGNTVIEGTLDSRPNSTFLIQFFSSSECDPSAFGEGQRLIGSITVTSGASCVTSFAATFASASVRGAFITATATRSGSSTSEFSRCIIAAPAGGGDRDGDGLPDSVEVAEGTDPLVKDNDIFNVARLFVMQQYRDFLGREGDPPGITFWTNHLTSGAQTRAQLVDTFFTSAEFAAVTPITRLYFAYFLRIPDYDGLLYWTNQYRAGVSLDAISQAFAQSPEFIDRYGSLTNEEFVALVYQNVLGRPADPGGLAFWTGHLDNATMTRGQVMLAFSESAENLAVSFNKVFVVQIYVGMLRRSPEQAGFDYWVGQLASGRSSLDLIQGFLDAEEYHDRFLP